MEFSLFSLLMNLSYCHTFSYKHLCQSFAQTNPKIVTLHSFIHSPIHSVSQQTPVLYKMLGGMEDTVFPSGGHILLGVAVDMQRDSCNPVRLVLIPSTNMLFPQETKVPSTIPYIFPLIFRNQAKLGAVLTHPFSFF